MFFFIEFHPFGNNGVTITYDFVLTLLSDTAKFNSLSFLIQESRISSITFFMRRYFEFFIVCLTINYKSFILLCFSNLAESYFRRPDWTTAVIVEIRLAPLPLSSLQRPAREWLSGLLENESKLWKIYYVEKYKKPK